MRVFCQLCLCLLFLVSCSSQRLRPFPAQAPFLKDTEDFREFTPAPAEYKAATIWDGVDETLLRPIPKLFSFKQTGRAKNVNALEEVPESSWWSSRGKTTALTPLEVQTGACREPIDPKGPFEVLSAKPDGWNPGFLVKTPNGKKYFFKFDQHAMQPERMSAAEVIGSLIYHSTGFTVPCYEILYFDRSAVKLSKNATMKNKKGEKVPMTEEALNEAFRLAKKTADGHVRAVSSLLLEGTSLGPWSYAGTVGDDPNDVIPHEDRREIRSGYVLASWINHFDTRDQNTLSTWIIKEGKKTGYVRHNILDFGDSIGNISDDDSISRRLGHSYYFDFPYFLGDFFTFGFIQRPWDKNQYSLAGANLGYFDLTYFNPEIWQPGYPNPAFQNVQEADGAWMARQIAKFRDIHVKAIVDRAQIQNTVLKDEIIKILLGRRDKVLKHWLKKLSPLAEPELRANKLCFLDLLLYSHLASEKDRTYLVSEMDTKEGKRLFSLKTEKAEQNTICIPLGEEKPIKTSFRILELTGKSPENPEEMPLRAHLYQEKGSWHIAGVERLE